MPAPNKRITGGSPGANQKLNKAIDRTNELLTLRGDGQFIAVRHNSFGTVISLLIDAVVSRIPKVLGEGSVPAGVLFAVKVKKVGGDPGGNGTSCSFVYDVYPASTAWPGSGDPPTSERLLASASPETEVIPYAAYAWVPTGVWGWGTAFQVLEDDVLVTYLYNVADERPMTHTCDCE